MSETEADGSRCSETVNARVRNGDAVTDGRRAELLAIGQRFQHNVLREAGGAAEMFRGGSEKRGLVVDGGIEKYIFVVQDFGETDSFWHMHLPDEA